MIKTNEKIKVTLNGWDGKSYNGEFSNKVVYVNKFNDNKFVKFGSHFFLVTDEKHETTGANKVIFWS